MGVSLYNKEYCMDMGYGTFMNLRSKVAHLYNEEFGKAYDTWIKQSMFGGTSSIHMQEIINKFYEDNIFTDDDDEALDFLFLSDCEGKVSPNGCKKLYNKIKNYDDNYIYGYVHANHTFSYFKEMINDCAKRKRNLYWN